MCIVQLDGDLLREQLPVAVGATKSAHEIAQRAGDEKEFLDEPQSLPLGCRVVRIEDARDRFGGQCFGQGATKLP